MVSMVFLLSALAAGLCGALVLVSIARPLGTWGAPEMIGLLVALAVVFHAGVVATIVVFLRKPGEYEWLLLGRPAWLSMFALCYVAGVGIGVISTA